MSTGKRLAKRSIIGTRVCAPGDDGKYYSCVIQAVKSQDSCMENNNCINLTPNTRYSVRFDSRHGNMEKTAVEFTEVDLIGPGFRSVVGLVLLAGQNVFVTYNGREIGGEVVTHDQKLDAVTINVLPAGNEESLKLIKRLEEVRLLESRKSARLADSDTNFAFIVNMGSDRKRTASHFIDVPTPAAYHIQGSRKRSPNGSQDENAKDPGSSSFAPWRSSPSPPPLELPSLAVPVTSDSVSNEGIAMDYPDELPPKKKPLTRMVFQCIWPRCLTITSTCDKIEEHIRNDHLNARGIDVTDREKKVNYTEVELASSLPTMSHWDMARPPHEDPEYQRLLVGSFRQSLLSDSINIPLSSPSSSRKLLKPSPRPRSFKKLLQSPCSLRVEIKKCRKFYGLEHREQWCTQCKWKKACSRFGE